MSPIAQSHRLLCVVAACRFDGWVSTRGAGRCSPSAPSSAPKAEAPCVSHPRLRCNLSDWQVNLDRSKPIASWCGAEATAFFTVVHCSTAARCTVGAWHSCRTGLYGLIPSSATGRPALCVRKPSVTVPSGGLTQKIKYSRHATSQGRFLKASTLCSRAPPLAWMKRCPCRCSHDQKTMKSYDTMTYTRAVGDGGNTAVC